MPRERSTLTDWPMTEIEELENGVDFEVFRCTLALLEARRAVRCWDAGDRLEAEGQLRRARASEELFRRLEARQGDHP